MPSVSFPVLWSFFNTIETFCPGLIRDFFCQPVILNLSIWQLFYSATYNGYKSFNLSLNFLLQPKVTVFLPSSIISFPVAGFRPFLTAFSFTWNLPNPDIMTSSWKRADLISKTVVIKFWIFEPKIFYFVCTIHLMFSLHPQRILI